jgi:hypothetical protein
MHQQEERAAGERRLWESQRQALLSLLDDLSSLSPSTPSDGFANRDHDRILYSGKS